MDVVANVHSFMGDLPEEILSNIQEKLTSVKTVRKGEIIFQGGDEPDALYQMITGKVALRNYAVDGQEIILTKYLAGDWFGDTGIIDERPRINTAIAIEDSQIVSLSRGDFHALCDDHPRLLKAFCVMQAKQHRLLLNLLVDASLLRLSSRILRTLQRLAVAHGNKGQDGLLSIDSSHEELAHFVAASRQSTSIELKKLEQSGIIKSAYGKIIILEMDELNRLCEELTSFEAVAPGYDSNGSE